MSNTNHIFLHPNSPSGLFFCCNQSYYLYSSNIYPQTRYALFVSLINHPLLYIFHYGKWNSDAIVLFETIKKFEIFGKKKAPLLTIRLHGHCGILIWLNSADKSDAVAKSLSEPHGNIIKLIYNSITYKKEIVEYHKVMIGHEDK
jgi:hypothetical protein